MLQQLKSLLDTEENRQANELDEILNELRWDQHRNCYIGSQSAVSRITGMDRPGIRTGLGLNPDRRTENPKLLTWLSQQGISAVAIQKEWAAGQISDKYIPKLIQYAATQSRNPTVEANRWLDLIVKVGFRGTIHQLKGREDLLDRATARGKNLTPQRRVCDRIQQTSGSYQHVRSQIVKGIMTKTPQHLKNTAQKQGIKVQGNWRSHADADSLVALSMTEDGYSVTGNQNIGMEIRDILMRNGWSGEVEFSPERISCEDARDMNKLAKRQGGD